MAFTYRATKNGTLSNPYRLIETGGVFTSPVEMKGSWFVPVEQYKEPKPVSPFAGLAQPAPVAGNTLPNIPSSESFQQSLEGIKALEAAQDGTSESSGTGTGDQDVL